MSVFQFTPLREGRPKGFSNAEIAKLFQFTPLREGRLTERKTSIRATIFQFTPLREGRQLRGEEYGWIYISIHAPPRGATPCPGRCRRFPRYFNSRPSARGDGITFACKPHALVFQFTPLREGRRGLSVPHVSVRHAFQFTPLREGRPEQVECDWKADKISIHAPPRGATWRSPSLLRAQSISIHAPPRGATAKDMQFLQIFCSTLTNQHGLTIVPRNLSRLFW